MTASPKPSGPFDAVPRDQEQRTKENDMGLDMMACVTREKLTKAVDFEPKRPDDVKPLHYWRKHPNLHGWMEQLYRDKGGAQEFNCVCLLLTPADLDQLEQDIQAKVLPHTVGFFFGQSDGSEDADDLEFIRLAREAQQRGESVFYTSWW